MDNAVGNRTYIQAILKNEKGKTLDCLSFCDQDTLERGMQFSWRKHFQTVEIWTPKSDNSKLVVVGTLTREEFKVNGFDNASQFIA